MRGASLFALARHATALQLPGFGCCFHAAATAAKPSSEPVSTTLQESTVVLVDGGIESATLLSYWKHWGHAQTLQPLFVQFGQENAEVKERAQHAVCEHLDLDFSNFNVMTSASFYRTFRHSELAEEIELSRDPEGEMPWLPPGSLHHRHLLLLSVAANFADKSGAANLAICLNKDDLSLHSTVSLPFLHSVETLFQTLEPSLQLLTPLLELRMEQVVKMGQAVGAPWHLTYSCTEDEEQPCKQCFSCKQRAAAFNAAGVEDTLFTKAAGVLV